MDIGKLIRQSAERFGDNPAVWFIDEEREKTLSFEDIENRSNRIAHGLQSVGIGKGDCVALISHNSPEFLDTFFATQKLGAIITPVNARLTADEIEYILSDADPTIIVVESELLESKEGLSDRLEATESEMFVIGDSAAVGDSETYHPFTSLMSADSSDTDVDIDADTVDGYFYTSGHTGKPKGVIHTQGDRIFLNMNLLAELGIRRSDINLHPFPLFHSGPLHTSLVPFIQFGVPTVLMRSFDPERMLECIDEYEATVVGGAPAMLDELIRVGGVDEYDLDSVRFWWFSGAPLTETVRDRCIDLFGEEYSEIYGSTEVGPPISVLQPEEAPASGSTIRIVWFGRPVPHDP
jgi:fatty-acyl-CoA synthase